MKFLPETQVTHLTPGLYRNLTLYRATRNFNSQEYILRKTKLLQDYCKYYDIENCVLGVSGGIDSAVVLELLHHAQIKVYPLIITAPDQTTHQKEALTRVTDHGKKLGITIKHLDISQQVRALDQDINPILDTSTSAWSLGQLVSNLRTTYLHHVATRLNDQVGRTVVMGTCNLDEGGYLGYIGKMSDGLVDIQPIADLHKSEVYALARQFKVPDPIITALPSGDMFDSRDDLDVMGATYDFVELLRFFKNDPQHFTQSLTTLDSLTWQEAFKNLERLHQFNSHKYEVSLPSVFLDVMDSWVRDGWNNKSWKQS